MTVKPKRRAHRNKTLKHQAKRIETARRFDELRAEHGRTKALELLASEELKLQSTKAVEQRLKVESNDGFSEPFPPWFDEFLAVMNTVTLKDLPN